MRAQEALKEIKVMDAKIDIAIQEIRKLQDLAIKTTSVLGDDRVQTSGSKERMADYVTKFTAMREQVTKEINDFYDYKNAIRQKIYLCDPDCAKLLYKRYFEYKSWERIACEMGFTYKHVSWHLHRKALSQLDMLYKAEE